MASLQARHSRSCTAFPGRFRPAARTDGCTCTPTFYVVTTVDKKLIHENVGKVKRDAQRALKKIEGHQVEGTFQPIESIRFDAWADRWHKSLSRPKENTRYSYKPTIAYAKLAFGSKTVRKLTPADVTRMVKLMADGGLSPSTQAKHLRVLNACLRAAVENGYAPANPMLRLGKSQRPRVERREAPYFLNGELPKLLGELRDDLYYTLFRVALETGMRQGELLALTWGDVNLSERVIHVRRSFSSGRFVSTPKSHETRDVDITKDTQKLLGKWWGEQGKPGDDELVFPGEGKHGYLSQSTLTNRVLYPAMERAKIPRECPEGRARGQKRTFHSFRHTFAKVALENGRDLGWLSRHLGHSSTAVTDRVYSHFESSARRAQVDELEGAFPS